MVEGLSAKPDHWRKAKKRGRPREFHKTTPPPPAKRIGGEGRIFREICRFSPFRSIIWRRGSNLREKCKVPWLCHPIIRRVGRVPCHVFRTLGMRAAMLGSLL